MTVKHESSVGWEFTITAEDDCCFFYLKIGPIEGGVEMTIEDVRMLALECNEAIGAVQRKETA